MASLEAIQPQKVKNQVLWYHHRIGLEKLPQNDPSNVEICPVVQKLHFDLLEVIESQQTVESTQFDVTIELALKNYPKKTPQMLKSVQWFKSYIFGLFRGHTASKKWKIKFRRSLYGQGDGAWQFSGLSGEGERMSRNSDLDHIVYQDTSQPRAVYEDLVDNIATSRQ